MKARLLLLLFLLSCFGILKSQIVDDFLGDEGLFYSETKQINQFFRRFNNEEAPDGIRYYKRDKEYRNPATREKYLDMLFNLQNSALTESLRNIFKADVINKDSSRFLNFHSDGWFAEVKTRFSYKGEDKFVTFFLELEQENMGYKWVITNVYFEPFAEVFFEKKSDSSKFLHPMSHEIDFMNLIRVFNNQTYIDNYTLKSFQADFLTLFLYEFKQGYFEFKYVEDLKFHFFQIPGWYFEIEQFVRSDYNSGWLISKLTKISQEEKSILLKYIYHN
ncbi:MAG: hypothetical protein PF484_03130 [Bacteroidales bacterium]|jgi:hypothetical protein|nr:hypothetical protein [Bacteroidales bacterium]